MRNLQLATLALAGAALLACGKERRPAIGQAPGGQVTVPDPDGGPATTVDLAACTRCHGDVTRSASGADPAVAVSPPRSVKGELTSSARGVGAHQAHLVDGLLARAVACTSCHRIPSGIDDHAAPVGRVRFRGMAILGGAAPSYDAAAGSCASTYCHGSFRNGNAANAPAWTGPQATCDSCHAIPPPSPAAGGTHPAVGAPLACDGCHVGYTPDTVNAATHVDGRIDVSGSCSLCHGDPPPPSPAGTTPVSHHPQNDRCSLCHDGYSDGTATPRTTGSTHMDGKVDHVALSCTTCHGDPARPGSDAKGQALAPAPPSDSTGEVASGAVGAHQAHLVSPSSSARVACDECHAVPAAGSELHADATADVAFGALARTVLPGDGRTVTPVWTAASLTCSATYCHGNFRNGNAGNAPAWTGTAGCGSCHDLPPAGTHPAAAPGACATCHPGYAAGAPDPLTHLDGQVDLSLTCSSCHGDGARVPVASATALDPLGANLVKASPPLDTQGGTGPAVGAHLAHVNQGAAAPELSAAIACATCHPVPTGLAHSNLSVDVAFTGVAAASGAAFAAGTHTCSSTYCHGNFPGGNGANPVVWTAAGKLACTACHGSPPGPVSAAVHHPQNPTCGACHAGYTASLVVAATHVDGTVQKPPAGCTQCHGDITAAGVASTDVRAAPASNASAVDTHGNAAAATSQRGVGAHQKHLTGTTWRSAAIACGECHLAPPAGDTAHASSSTATVTFGALASTAWSGPAIAPVWNGAGGAGTLTCSSTYCHGNFRNGANATPTWATPSAVACGSCHGTPPGGTHPATASQNCGNCHPGYDYDPSTGLGAGVDKSRHVNGQLDGGGEPASGGSSCGGCHGAIATQMTTAVGPPLTRHFLGGGDNPLDGGQAWTGPLKSAPAYAVASCVNMCHGDHPHDLTSPATPTHEFNVHLDATGRSSGRTDATRDDTDFDGAAANGGLCLSCHRNAIDAGHPALDQAAFAASAHNFVAAAGQTWSYVEHDGGVFGRNCTKCHADRNDARPSDSTQPFGAVHFSSYPSLLAGSTNTAGGANSPAVFICYNCHGNFTTGQNLSDKDVATQIEKAYRHPANTDASHDAAAEAATAWGNALGFGEANTVARRHASCLDCHEQHQALPSSATTRVPGSATSGNLAGAPLHGATGAELSTSPGFWAATGAGSFTYKAIAANTDLEATLCFKCHSSFYWGAGTVPSSPSLGAAQTDTAREFNPANVGNWGAAWASGDTAGSFHPVLASAGSNLGASNNIKAPFTRTSLMTCTDCHESETATDLNGPHGSTARFLLKGPNTAWSSSLVTGASGMPAGTFCINCHNQDFTGSRYTAHTNGNHRIACTNCHAAIPHGGPRPGLLVSGAGATAAVGGVIAGWDQSAPYWSGATSNRLYIIGYPANASTNWSRGNCSCDGSGH